MSDSNPYFEIPGPKSQELLARRQQFVARGVGSTMNVFAAKADGAMIEDVDGNRYIDFAGGIGAMNIGHARPEVTRAIAEQAARFTHTCFSVMMYEPYVALAERIVKITPGSFPKKAPRLWKTRLRSFAMPQDVLLLSSSTTPFMVVL